MKKRVLQLLCGLMALLLLSMALLACKDETPDEDRPGVDTPGTDTPGTNTPGTDPGDGTEEIDYLMQVPAVDFGQSTITILAREDTVSEMDIEEADVATSVDEAIFNRNARVEEYLNVEILNVPVPGAWGVDSSYNTALDSSIATGDNAYQLSSTALLFAGDYAVNEWYHDLTEYTDSIDLSAPWWAASFTENARLGDSLYHVIGDISVSMWKGIYAIFFNRQIQADYSELIDNVYQTVRNGDWTLEVMAFYTERVYTNLDGDDVSPDRDDLYGLLFNTHSIRAMATTCELPIVANNEEGIPELVFMNGDNMERVEEIYAALYDLLYENDGCFRWPSSDDHPESVDMFTEQKGLFLTTTLERAETVRQVEMEFGIIPMPKYDSEQEYYKAHVSDHANTWAIPLSCWEPEMAAKVLDALGAESKTSVIPVYYDVILQNRIAQDTDSKEMLDLIRQHLHFDFGYIYSNSLMGSNISGPFAYFGDVLVRRSDSMSSAWASSGQVFEGQLKEIVEKFWN